MPDWVGWAALVVGTLLVLTAVPIAWLIGRRRWLSNRGRVFDCSLRLPDSRPGAGWMLGAARYREDSLEWYRVFSLSLRPRVRLRRDETHVLRVRQPEPLEVGELYDDQVVAELGDAHAGLWVAMSRDDMTAFHSWTEAGPPGQHFSS